MNSKKLSYIRYYKFFWLLRNSNGFQIQTLKHNAASLILIHNHPSGDPEPSQDDLEITKRLREAGQIMRPEIIDHLIISHNNYYSFKEHQLMK